MRHLKVEKQRSEPPKIVRTREVKKTLTEEEEDALRYLGAH